MIWAVIILFTSYSQLFIHNFSAMSSDVLYIFLGIPYSSLILFPGYSQPSTNVRLWVQTDMLGFIEAEFLHIQFSNWEFEVHKLKEIHFLCSSYVNISGRSMWVIRWRRDNVHNIIVFVQTKIESSVNKCSPWEEAGCIACRNTFPLPTRWPRWYSRTPMPRHRSLYLRVETVETLNHLQKK